MVFLHHLTMLVVNKLINNRENMLTRPGSASEGLHSSQTKTSGTADSPERMSLLWDKTLGRTVAPAEGFGTDAP